MGHPVVQGVQEKLCFFTIHCNPSLAYIAVIDLLGSQRNEGIQNFCKKHPVSKPDD